MGQWLALGFLALLCCSSMRLFLTWLVPMALFASWFGWRDARAEKAHAAELLAARPHAAWAEPVGTLSLFPGYFLDYTVIGDHSYCSLRH